MFWVALSIRGGGIDSPRPASQRAAAFILTAAMLITLSAPAFAGTWCIDEGNITVKAGDTKGKNTVSQGNKKDVEDTNTIITGTSNENTVTIDTSKGNVDVTFDDLNIDASSRKEAAMSVTGSGNTTIKLDGDNHLTGGNGRSGIDSIGSLTIYGGENDSLTAKGGSGADGSGGDGIHSGSLTIYGGTVNANGGNCGDGNYSDGGSGIRISSRSLTIYDGKVNAKGGNGGDGNYSDGGSGISSNGSLTVSGGTVTANGGNGGSGGGNGGDGITSNGGVTISSGSTVTANGGRGEDGSGGSGISNGGSLTVSDGTVTAKGGNGDSKDGYGGDGIRSGGGVTISGNTVNAAGGYGGKVGGYGICSFDRVAISGGTVNANGGSGQNGNGGSGIIGSGRVAVSGGTVNAAGGDGGNGKDGGDGIYSSDIDLSGSLELTAKAGSPNGKALSQRGYELDLDTIKDKLGPGAKVTATDANGETKQVSIPRPVEPEGPVIPGDSSSSSDGGSAAPSAPASSLPGLTVTDKDGQRISYTSTQSGNTLTVCVGRLTASFRISLAALRQLRAEGIETITFQTILCSTTLSVDELLAMGGEDAEAVLTHRFTDSSLTVG